MKSRPIRPNHSNGSEIQTNLCAEDGPNRSRSSSTPSADEVGPPVELDEELSVGSILDGTLSAIDHGRRQRRLSPRAIC